MLCHEIATDDEPKPIGVQARALDAMEHEEEEYDAGIIGDESRKGDPLERKMSILPTHLGEARTTRSDQLRNLLMKEKAVSQSIFSRVVSVIHLLLLHCSFKRNTNNRK